MGPGKRFMPILPVGWRAAQGRFAGLSRRESARRGLLSARPALHGLAARGGLRSASEQPAEDRSLAVVARVGIVLRQARRPVGGVGFALLDPDVGQPVLVALHDPEVTRVAAVDV